MAAKLNRLWVQMNQMPGPVWIFGAWAVFRFVKWVSSTLPGWIPFPSMNFEVASLWLTIGIFAAMCVGQLLPLVVVWVLICKKQIAVSLCSLYVGLRALYFCICLLMPLLTVVPDWARSRLYGRWPDQLPMILFECVVWTAFLFYLEWSKDVEQVFPTQTRRRAPWWLGVVFVSFVLLLGQ